MSTSIGPITLDAPVSSLIFQSMIGREEIGRPYLFSLELLGTDATLDPDVMLGQPMTVHLELRDGGMRHFHGFVSHFAQTGLRGEYAQYAVTLRPWLWFLTRTTNCRIFQNQTAVSVVKAVFREHGFTDFDESLTESYDVLDYIVQYRETDFAFVSRLLEQEGIYYYFRHGQDKHKLVLCDSYSAHASVLHYAKIPFIPPNPNRDHLIDYIDDWRTQYAIQAGAVALKDFDFERPTAKLMQRKAHPNPHTKSDYEIYDYPGGYIEGARGDTQALHRIEELNIEYARATGHTNARGVGVGNLLTLSEHPVARLNIEYLIQSAKYELHTHDPRSNSGEVRPVFDCQFGVVESSKPFRAARLTPKPVVGGPQTAVVVGKKGQEIWCDEHGRVKVKFHWDRESEGNENSSCWVRVAQTWAGNGWGSMHIPRVGQEVIVDFLEGDPDRPIITGRVYNGDNPPPYKLPAHQTQSGIKSRSTKDGGPSNFNEIRFEDMKGSEELFMQAEKDKRVLVKHDRSTSVGNDDLLEITQNRTKKIGKDEKVDVGANRTEKVTVNESITIGANRDLKVGGNSSATVTGNVTRKIAGNESDTVAGNVTQTIAGSRMETVAGAVTQTVAGGITITTPAAVTIAAAAGVTIVAPGGTKTIDSFFDKTGGKSADAFAFKMSVVGAKVDLVAGLALSMSNSKIDMAFSKIDLAKSKYNNHPVIIETLGTAICQSYVHLHVPGLMIVS
jgi:type VI secretion system secreted protein VgrG